MGMNPIEKNLLLLLDPARRYDEKQWDFCDGSKALSSLSKNVIFCFTRSRLLDYWLLSFNLLFSKKYKSRKLLFVHDGLLSSLFDAANASAYRAFAINHLPQPKTFRQRISRLLPVVMRAETRYLVVYANIPPAMNVVAPEILSLEQNDFMFFSNATGKLLIMMSKTMLTGRGELVKTTADSEYSAVMAKEYATVKLLSRKLGKAGCLPILGDTLNVNGRHFFAEEYVLGESLRERLRVLGENGKSVSVCNILDSLDNWFRFYHASFTADVTPISTVYAHLFPLFRDCYGDGGAVLLRTGTDLLHQFANAHPSVVPITAHNDLWPGNFVMTDNGFIVIDWERATENRAPFFDYFWLIISTAIEALASEIGNNDYSQGVRMFLRCADDVSLHAFRKLKTFLDKMGIGEEYLPHLLFTFFMEWSVQGFQVLGRQTFMDGLAFGELQHFAETINVTNQPLAASKTGMSEPANA